MQVSREAAAQVPRSSAAHGCVSKGKHGAVHKRPRKPHQLLGTPSSRCCQPWKPRLGGTYCKLYLHCTKLSPIWLGSNRLAFCAQRARPQADRGELLRATLWFGILADLRHVQGYRYPTTSGCASCLLRRTLHTLQTELSLQRSPCALARSAWSLHPRCHASTPGAPLLLSAQLL